MKQNDLQQMQHPVFFLHDEIRHFGHVQVHSSIDAYITYLTDFMNKYLDETYQGTAFEDPNVRRPNIKRRITRDLDYGVRSRFTDSDDVEISMSLGTILALQDIALSAGCLNSFMNARTVEDGLGGHWPGGQQINPPEFIAPRRRFKDYRPQMGTIDDATLDRIKNAGINPLGENGRPWIGWCTRAFPMDLERLSIAAYILHYSVYFMFIHEESHFLNGHFYYLMDKSNSLSADELARVKRGFEHQADRDASRGMVDVFFRPEHYPFSDDHFPEYAQTDWFWLHRFIVTSIGISLFLAQMNGEAEASNHYPPIGARLLTVLREMEAALLRKKLYVRMHHNTVLGNNTEKHFGERSFRAGYGSLVDLTELRISRADDLGIDEEIWPAESGFADMASNALLLAPSHYTKIADSALLKALLDSEGERARYCMRKFECSMIETAIWRERAYDWIKEFDALVAESNRTRIVTDAFKTMYTQSQSR